jgi:hypothetical protein
MKCILGLSTLGLLLLAGTSSAQEPSAAAGSSSAPVVQSAPQGGYVPAASSSRRFGRWRGGNSDGGARLFGRRASSNNGNVVSTGPVMTSQPVVQASATTPNAESKPVMNGESGGSPAPTVMADANPPVQQSNAVSSRRGSRGGLLSRLAARRGQ